MRHRRGAVLKALVAGLGSIGRRHGRNLRALGHEIVGFDPVEERRATFAAEVEGAAVAATLDEALQSGCDLAVIASPNVFHLEQSIRCAEAGLALFIEKPLATSMDGVDALRAAASSRGTVILMGSNWKFHPGPRRLREIVRADGFGEVLAVQSIGGQYLPDWHPWEDYRGMYSSRASMGGGVLLDSHDVDYLTWIAGPVKTVACHAIRTGTLEIETNDLACLLVEFESGARATMQIDYLQRPFARRVHVTGKRGTAIWDYVLGLVRWYDAGTRAWTDERQPAGDYDINQMYVDEMRHFLDCVEQRRETITPLSQASHVLSVLDAARRSAGQHGAPVAIS